MSALLTFDNLNRFACLLGWGMMVVAALALFTFLACVVAAWAWNLTLETFGKQRHVWIAVLREMNAQGKLRWQKEKL